MNCLQYRRLMLTDPAALTPEAREHAKSCPDCRHFRNETEEIERQIRAAASIEVPENLATRIKLRQAFQKEPTRPFYRPWHLALAATLLVVTTIGGALGHRMYTDFVTAREFRVAALDYLKNQAPAPQPDDRVDQGKLSRLVDAFGGELTGAPVTVQLAELCAVGDRPAAHLVVPGSKGPVSVIYTSDARVRGPTLISDPEYDGIHVSTRQGSMAVFGERGEPLNDVVSRVAHAISW